MGTTNWSTLETNGRQTYTSGGVGLAPTTVSKYGYIYHNSATGNRDWSNSWDGYPITAWLEYGLWTGSIHFASDERIKTEINDLSDNNALELIRNIPSREYHYTDTFLKQPTKTVGFIAQEVKEVLPESVTLSRGFIPDEQRLLDNSNIIWEDCFDTSGNVYGYLLTVPEYDVSANTHVKFICSDDDFDSNLDISTNNYPEINEEEILVSKREDEQIFI